jgi:hypothetical protein
MQYPYKDGQGNFSFTIVDQESGFKQVVFYCYKIRFTGFRGVSTPEFMVPLDCFSPSKKMLEAANNFVKNYFAARPQARMPV